MTTEMTGPIAGVLFDKDGTLFDFNATWGVWAHGFLVSINEGDQTRIDEMSAAIGFDFQTRRFHPESPVIAGTPNEIAGALLRFFEGLEHDDLVVVMNDLAAQAPQAEAVPLRAFIEGLRAQGLVLGVATNDAEAPARAHLERAEILELFDFVVGYDSGHGGKPAPGQLLAFCGALNVAPERCVMVGDSRHDLEAGAAAGMYCVGVLTGIASAADLAPHADVVLQNIGELPAWIAMQDAQSVPQR